MRRLRYRVALGSHAPPAAQGTVWWKVGCGAGCRDGWRIAIPARLTRCRKCAEAPAEKSAAAGRVIALELRRAAPVRWLARVGRARLALPIGQG